MLAATWTLRRSPAPDLLAALMVAASGGSAMGSEGWLWWAGLTALVVGFARVVATVRRRPETLRLTLAGRVRLERTGPDSAAAVLAEGLLEGDSVVTGWLIALRIRRADGRHARLVLTAGSAPADELRRLRVRLLGDARLRA